MICTERSVEELTNQNHPLVHVIDDDPTYAQALAFLLRDAGYDVEVYMSAEHFLCTYKPRKFQCVVLDMRMPGMNGLELQEQLRARYQTLPVIVISAYGDTATVVQSIRKGALDFLDKPVNDGELIAKVNEAITKTKELALQHAQRDEALARLSAREREVLDLFLGAKTTIQIAHQLGISPKTVEKHRLNIYAKTRVDSIPGLMRLIYGV